MNNNKKMQLYERNFCLFPCLHRKCCKHSRLCRYLLYVFDNKAVFGGYVCGKQCPNRAPAVPLGGGAGSSLLHCLPYSASNGAS